MTVLENVQTALLSFHRRLRSFRPRPSRLYLDEAYALLELVGMADQADRLCSVLAYGDLKRRRTGDGAGQRAEAAADGRADRRHGAGRAGRADAAGRRHRRTSGRIGILFTEHDMDVVFAHAARVMVLDRGRLIADRRRRAEVRADPAGAAIYLGEEDIG